MKRILIADDHAIVRKGLKETLEDELGELIVGEAGNTREILDLIWREKWDLVLLDIGMQGRSGLEALEDIKKARAKVPVLIISMYPEAEFGARALEAGASGYINKQGAPEELVAAVSKVLAGGQYISSKLAECLVMHIQKKTDKPLHDRLSTRELEVMCLVASGKSLKEIADHLSISVKTVGTYHTRLLEKMRMKSDVELTRYALKNNLVT